MTPSNNNAAQHGLPLGTAALMAGVGLLLMTVSARLRCSLWFRRSSCQAMPLKPAALTTNTPQPLA